MNRKLFVSAVAALALGPQLGEAQTMTVPDALARLFDAPTAQPEWFNTNFLAAIPIEKVRTITDSIKANLGAYQSAAFTQGRYTLTFARGSLRADAVLDDSGNFTTLLVNNMISTDAMERITALLQTDSVPAAWFSDHFLATIPTEKTDALIANMKTKFGPFRSLAPADDGSYNAAFANGTVNVRISLGTDGRIEGLFFRPL